VLKSQDAHLHFVLLTGVCKFSKVSLFSGLNNLEDITLDSRYATVIPRANWKAPSPIIWLAWT